MKLQNCTVLFGLGLLAGCLEDVQVEGSTPISCSSNVECPEGFVCRTSTQFCVQSSGAAKLSVAQVSSPSVEPLETEPPLVLEDVLPESETSFVYEGVVPEFGDDGIFGVSVRLVDINANEVTTAFDDQFVTLDFTPPSFAALVAENTLPLAIGASLALSFTPSEALSSIEVTLPGGESLDGSPFRRW